MSWRSAVLFAFLSPLALLGGSGSPACFHGNPSISTRAKLAEILGPCRLAEGRFTGGFAYARFDPVHSGFRLSKGRRIALRKLSREISGSIPEAVADRALLKLLDGDARRAVELLEAASAAKPNSASLLSDLAAAYLADARINNDPYARVKALEVAESAVSIDPSLREARFNRALALESLFLKNQAKSAWDGYLKLDGKSGWAWEARDYEKAADASDAASRWALQERRLDEAAARNDQATVSQIVRDFPQASREYAEERLLGEWAMAELAKQGGEVREKRAILRAIGNALARDRSEGMVAAAVSAIDHAVASQKRSRLALLMAGHYMYQKGLELYDKGKFSEARECFKAAMSALRHAASPFALWATFRLAVCEMQLFNYSDSFDLLTPLCQSDFRSLAGRSLWVQGLILGIQGKYAESLSLYRQAIRRFAVIGETENLTVVRSRAAECFALLGDLENAWKLHLDALSLAKDLRSAARRQQLLDDASLTALQGQNPAVMLDFLQEALGAASPPPTPVALYCLRQKALAHGSLRQFREAMESLRAAESMVPKLPDEDARKSMRGDLLAAEGRILTAGDPSAAIAQLTKAIHIYNGTDYAAQLALLFSERARAYRAIGDLAATEADLKRAVSLVGSQRALVKDAALRSSYLEELRSIFDDMVDLQVRLGRGDRALDYAESARSQALLELLADLPVERAEPVSTTDSLRAGLPRHIAFIEYQMLPQVLLAWVVRQDSVTVFQTRISPVVLKSLVAHFRSEAQAPAPDLRRDVESRHLSTLLIGGLKPALKGATALVIAPDRDLYEVPFSALVDDATGGYLVERYALSVVPSGKIYLEAMAHERGVRGAGATVLGDPAFALSLLDDLPRLPHAGEEAKRIASIYPKARLRLGPEATSGRFLAALESAEVIHFAGHAINNAVTPMASFLVLAPAGNSSGILYARDLYKVRKSAARLVVLSACSSLAGKDLGREGVENLVRPFLAMGVPAVVASLWQVSDRPTSALMAELHRRFHGGASPAEALRQAQLMMSSSADPAFAFPASWAGFQLNGVIQGGNDDGYDTQHIPSRHDSTDS